MVQPVSSPRLTARIRYTMIGALFGAAFPIASSILFVVTNHLPFTIAGLLQSQVNNPLQWIINTAPLFLGLFAFIAGVRQDRVTLMNFELTQRLVERSQLIGDLENTRNTLQKMVKRQVVQLQTAAEIASEALTLRETEQLLTHSAGLISDRFNFYHTGIFLLDFTGEYAVLRAASSEGGRRMLARGHKLRAGEVGIVGYVAESGQPRIALDVGTDAVFFDNPDLPQTRSEMALPLKIRNKVIGVLDVQSTQTQAFTADDVKILQTLADQLALAIENARLFEESKEAFRELQKLYQIQGRQAWRAELSQKVLAFEFDANGVRPAVSGGGPIPEIGDAHTLRVPLQLRGQTLGYFILQREPGTPAWSEYEAEIARVSVNQVTLALENARLLQETRRRAEHERIVTDISTHLWATTDIRTILRTALENLGRTLDVSDATIQLTPPDGPRSTAPGNGHHAHPEDAA